MWATILAISLWFTGVQAVNYNVKINFKTEGLSLLEGEFSLYQIQLNPQSPWVFATTDGRQFSETDIEARSNISIPKFRLENNQAAAGVAEPGNIRGTFQHLVIRRLSDGALSNDVVCEFGKEVTEGELRSGNISFDLSDFKQVKFRVVDETGKSAPATTFSLSSVNWDNTLELRSNTEGEVNSLLSPGTYVIIAGARSRFEVSIGDTSQRVVGVVIHR
jgi:hypothetical protein